MILLIIAIIVSAIFIAVEIPAFIRFHEEEDFLLLFTSGLMLASCLVVLIAWKAI